MTELLEKVEQAIQDAHNEVEKIEGNVKRDLTVKTNKPWLIAVLAGILFIVLSYLTPHTAVLARKAGLDFNNNLTAIMVNGVLAVIVMRLFLWCF